MTVEQPAHITPIKAIRKKCLDCSCGQAAQVRGCQVKDCPLFAFRLGRNPNRRGIGNRAASAPQSTLMKKQ
ncbi:MAG: hypothetical protein C4589_09485 [Peptococcaceae bacterium]|nr:MAG: hypothetical protein C4589_09485 [Peptococcaceae bacterium]